MTRTGAAWLSMICSLTSCATTQAVHGAAPVCERAFTPGPDVDEVRRLEQRGAEVNVTGWGYLNGWWKVGGRWQYVANQFARF